MKIVISNKFIVFLLLSLLLFVFFFPVSFFIRYPEIIPNKNSPQVLFVGDSIMQGYSASAGDATSVPKEFCAITKYSCINNGANGTSTFEIKTNFIKSVLEYKPKIIIANGGINDLAGTTIKKEFIDNWKTMLDFAKKKDTKVIVLLILPWTRGYDNLMIRRDDFNLSLIELISNYDNVMYVDAGSSVGMNRQSGPKGNLWNINKLYNEDGIHFLNEGDRRIALTIVKSIITQTSPVISNININPDKNKITVSWDSDKNTYGKVHYNIYQIPDTSRIAGATKTMQRHHLIEFNKLRSCTSYNVKVDSVINIFNKALSEDINVRTDGCISTQNLMALF